MKQYKYAQDDTSKINLSNTLCQGYLNIGKYDTALYYGNAALQLAKQLNYSKGIAHSFNGIGMIYYYKSNYTKALENYFASLKIREKRGDKKGIAASYNNIGNVYYIQNKYEKALTFFTTALIIQKKIGDKQGIAASYNNIGNTYYSQTSLLNKNDDSTKLNQSYENALKNYLASLNLKKEIDDKKGMTNSYNNIGLIYLSQAKYDKALESYFASLKGMEEIGDKRGIAGSYINIGSVYLAKSNRVEAERWFQKGMQLAKEIGVRDLLMVSYKGLSDAREKINDYKNAFKYNQLYYSIKDSLFNNENNKQIAELQIKYETEKKEKQIILLNNENKIKVLEIAKQQQQFVKHKILFVALIVGIILVIVISWLLISKNRIKQKEILKTELLKQQQLRTKAIIETQEMERKRIAQDLHDGIGHKLTILKFNFEKLVGNLLTVSSEQRTIFEQTENILDETHKEVRMLSHSMMPKALQEREFADAVSDLVEQTFANSKIKYSLKNNLPPEFPENIQVCLYRVLQELLNNILKYAQATEVAVQIFKNKSTIILFVEDNGIAIQNKNVANGIGLHNIAGRINVLNGVFTIEPGPVKGTVATIRIPLPQL